MSATRSAKQGRGLWFAVSSLAAIPAMALVLGTLRSAASAPTALNPDPVLEIGSTTLTSYKPTAKTKVNDARPRMDQRSVSVDGSGRAGSSLPIALAGNPFENVWSGSAVHNGMRLDTGTWSPTEIDLSFPVAGFRWPVIGRTFNARAESSGQYDSSGVQGYNWFQSSAPEIVFYDDADNSKDCVYLVLGADRYAEFQRKSSGATEFKGKNGAAGAFQYTAGSPDLYAYYDPEGKVVTFLGFNTASNAADGQIWKIEDANANKAYVGDATTASTAVSNGYDSSGRMLMAVDPSDRRFSFSYSASTIGGKKRLESVVVETKTSGTWASPSGVTERGRVEYSYYPDSPDPTYGDPGDLRTVKVTLPLTDSGVNEIRTTYMRYWEGAYNASTNPGYPHALKLVVSAEGVRQYDWLDSNFDDDHFTASHDSLKPYASAYFEYDTSHRINKAWFAGQCGCSGAGTGTHEYRYETNGSYSDNSGYDTTWARRTSVDRPDGSWITQYFDENGQPLSFVLTDSDPASATSKWVTSVTRDSAGCVTQVATPASVTGYTHDSGGSPSGAISLSSTVGLIRDYVRDASGDDIGFCTDIKWKKGTSGTAYYEKSFGYNVSTATKTLGAVGIVRPLKTDEYEYPTATTTQYSGADRHQWAYTTYSGASQPLAIEDITITPPAVTSGNNGSGTSDARNVHLKKDGTSDYSGVSDGTYRIVESTTFTNGQLTNKVQDKDTSAMGMAASYTSSGDEMQFSTTNAYDAQGRQETVTAPDGKVSKTYFSVLLDRRLVTIHYPKYVSGSGTYYGPAQFTVRNLAGKVEVEGTIAISGGTTTSSLTAHVDEAQSDIIAAIDVGTIARMSVRLYDETGSVLETERKYFSIPGSLPGTDGTHYDATAFGYDDMGRQRRTKEASGTIRRTVYDSAGRVDERWIGTNDSSFAGGEPSGTDNMVKVEETEYDAAADDGNSLVTKRTLYVQDDATNKRETSYSYDVRGNALLITTPTAPHILNAYDNQDRVTASGSFSSTGSIVVGTDDPVNEATNRLALTRTYYDELGRVWKHQRHQIDASDGSNDDNLQTLKWWDHIGRLAKEDGEELMKWGYDRLHRKTHEYTLASDNDASYANAVESVTGDAVLVQQDTGYETNSNNVLITSRTDRFHSDYGGSATTGALNTEADTLPLKVTASDVKGRVQITASWYDALDRIQDRVELGTYGAADYNRSGASAPARSDTALRTTNTYNDDGTLLQIEDPKSLKTRYAYDALGRKVTQISNYVDGTVSGETAVDDNYVRYEYTDGLQTKMWVDFDGDGVIDTGAPKDQVTTYTFATTKGVSAGDSKIGTGHLLQKVTYPDSASGSDVVTFAYNALGQELWKKDQAGNIWETDYDTSGRQTAKRVTTLASGFDGAVKRIATAYDSLGRIDTVTQYDAASSGSVVDQVKYTFDSWGNVSKLEQDRDSTVAGGGNDYEVSYTRIKNTTGRNTLKLTDMTLPSGTVITATYRSAGGLFDLDVSRVSQLKISTTAYVTYDYNGLDQVVGTYYEDPDVMSRRYSGAGTYPDLDLFNRPVVSKWTKDLSTDRDFFNVAVGWDRDSNVTYQDDSVYTGFDALYTNDNQNRLTQAQEGTYSGGTISSETRDQLWTLTQTGNWEVDKVDLNGDNDYIDASELNDDRTHNEVNEITARDIDDNGSDNYTLVHDAAGNLTDDGKDYEYEWDAFYRLRKVKRTDNQALVAEYKYNGLGYRISEHADTDTDGDVDANDKWYHHAYDMRWRIVATYRESDSSPKEQFVYQNAGLDGQGTGSYIDLVAWRDKDANTAWTAASDGNLEERLYYCQNWRADVVALVSSAGGQKEQVRYSAYGIPFGLPAGDADSDGDCDATDTTIVNGWVGGAYQVRGDIELDGDVDATDVTAVGALNGVTLGRNALSASGIGNRRGQAGYRLAAGVPTQYDVRHRTMDEGLGRWTSRDPLARRLRHERLYSLVNNQPVGRIDPTGLIDIPCPGTSGPLWTAASCDAWGFSLDMAEAKCMLEWLDFALDSLENDTCTGPYSCAPDETCVRAMLGLWQGPIYDPSFPCDYSSFFGGGPGIGGHWQTMGAPGYHIVCAPRTVVLEVTCNCRLQNILIVNPPVSPGLPTGPGPAPDDRPDDDPPPPQKTRPVTHGHCFFTHPNGTCGGH